VVRAETDASESEHLSFGINLYGNIEGETAKSVHECKTVLEQSRESLEGDGNIIPRYMITAGAIFALVQNSAYRCDTKRKSALRALFLYYNIKTLNV